MIDQPKRIGILWGGGLGDLLMIRPFLKAVQASRETQSYLMTATSHIPELLTELCSPTEVILLSRKPGHLFPVINKWRHFFDLIYLGPCPTLKTRILGRLLAPKKLWSIRHKNVDSFLIEQILADIDALGFSKNLGSRDLSSFLPWELGEGFNPFTGTGPFLVLHPGAKERWNTTLWPVEEWKQLVLKILEETRYSLIIAGTAKEEIRFNKIINGLPALFAERVKLSLSRPLKDLSSLILSSSGVICHNSGILHLSTFLKKETFCITGSSAKYWRPPYPWVFNITSGSCGLACNRYKCPIPFYSARCINDIKTEDVWNIINKIFQSYPEKRL